MPYNYKTDSDSPNPEHSSSHATLLDIHQHSEMMGMPYS